MDTLIGKICPFCQENIKEGDSVIVCPSCNIPHHEKCWYAHGGCTTHECLYQPNTAAESISDSGFDLSAQLDEIDFAPELPADTEQQTGGTDMTKGFMPTQLDTSFRSGGSGNKSKENGLNRSITIMSFMENYVEEDEKEYSKQRDERIKLGKQTLNVMNFTDENAVNQKKTEGSQTQQKPASLTKPQQSQHKASLTKPNQNRTQPAQKQNTNGSAGTKANLSKSQTHGSTKASLTKPNANVKPSLQKTTDTKPMLTRNGKPVNDKRPVNNPAANNKLNSAVRNINEKSVMTPANKANRLTPPKKVEVLCVKCKKLISSDQDFCPYCGAVQKEKEKPQFKRQVACPNCGGLVRADQVFCPRCGKKIEEHLTMREMPPSEIVPTEEVDTSVSSAVNTFSETMEQSRQNRKKRLIFTGVATALLVIAVLITTKATAKKDFKTMFSDIESNSWCEISDDGMKMTIDTNPDDVPDAIETMAYSRIKEINKALGFTDNIYRGMGSTKAADGEKYATFQKYKVTWKYHPDRGLEVEYTIQ